MSRTKRHKINNLLEGQWTEQLAWIYGVILGDGYSQYCEEDARYRVIITGAAEGSGRELLENWRELVRPDAPIVERTDPGSNAAQLTVNSKDFAGWLAARGINGKKAATLPWPTDIPEQFIPAFLRGIWDTDGSVLWKDRGPNREKQFNVSLCLRAQEFVETLAQEINRVMPFKVRAHETTLTKGRYAGKKFWAVWMLGPKGLKFAELIYGQAPPNMRHEDKWVVLQEYKKYVEAGCKTCGDTLHKRGFCRPHYIEWKYPNRNVTLTCACGTTPVIAKGLCNKCYQSKWFKARAERTDILCPCGKVAVKGRICSACCSRRQVERGKTGEKGPCSRCPGTAFVKGICKKCYDADAYLRKKARLAAQA